jgi:DNA mismatch repair protein MutS
VRPAGQDGKARSIQKGSAKLSPMLQQYLRVKAEHQDAILLFRLGDFYEMFFEDAEIASQILDITLTSRQRGEGAAAVPLCGVPYHAADPYIARLLAAGRKVAICEQREGATRGLMDREVVRVITQGTVLDEASLEATCPSYLAAVTAGEDRWGLAVVEFSTGHVGVTEVASWEALTSELERLHVREVIVPTSFADAQRSELAAGPWALNAAASDHVGAEEHWHRAWPLGRQAVDLAHGYLAHTYRGSLDHLQPAEPYESEEYLCLDPAARRNLELLTTLNGERRGSLLWVLDRTRTAMGARTLRAWMLAPLRSLDEIGRRLDAVEELSQTLPLREALADALRGIGDLERINGRVGTRTATPRDLVSLRAGLDRVARLRAVLAEAHAPLLVLLTADIDPLPAVRDVIEGALVEDPPAHLRAGGVVREGFRAEIDELRRLGHDGRSWIAELEARERKRTGIASLKVRYNKVFGYYIEVSKPNLPLVPDDYSRKQTLVNGERFVIPELKEYEGKVLSAEERLRALELEIFEEIVSAVVAERHVLAATAAALGQLDALISLGEVAHRRGYVRPQISHNVGLSISEGRHPVVEALVAGEGGFVPNDSALDPETGHIVVITGPNMAGKSTYLRQVALIVLMAQMGSFVPASAATIGVVDRIFTRVGAADNLSGGESTFMVEMRETANILRGISPRSLVILDEIGRGTSTFDGISIAWAVVECLHNHPTARPLTLFATHYHELTELPAVCPRVRNESAAVREWKGEVVFLRRIVPGPASRSYGIEVARLAGVPDGVVARAKEILASLEQGAWGGVPGGQPRGGAAAGDPAQGSLFEMPAIRLQRELASLDVERLTPLEALNYVGHLVQIARSDS